MYLRFQIHFLEENKKGIVFKFKSLQPQRVTRRKCWGLGRVNSFLEFSLIHNVKESMYRSWIVSY